MEMTWVEVNRVPLADKRWSGMLTHQQVLAVIPA